MFKIDTKKTKNFIVCCGENLPFKNGVFDKVITNQVIEHSHKPFLFFSELFRVCKKNGLINIETVHRLSQILQTNLTYRKWNKKNHVSFFNHTWFNKAVEFFNYSSYEFYIVNWLGFPHEYFSILKVPYIIGVKIIKG